MTGRLLSDEECAELEASVEHQRWLDQEAHEIYAAAEFWED